MSTQLYCQYTADEVEINHSKIRKKNWANILPCIPVNTGNIPAQAKFRPFKLAAAPVAMHLGCKLLKHTKF